MKRPFGMPTAWRCYVTFGLAVILAARIVLSIVSLQSADLQGYSIREIRLRLVVRTLKRHLSRKTLMSGDSWLPFEYEVMMFFGTAKRRREKEGELVVIENAIVESELLHIRVLSDVLLGRGHQDDDVSFEDLLPAAQRPKELLDALQELQPAYGTRSDDGSPCWELNKRLAHLTVHRGDRYDYSRLFKTIEPLLHRVLSQLAQV